MIGGGHRCTYSYLDGVASSLVSCVGHFAGELSAVLHSVKRCDGAELDDELLAKLKDEGMKVNDIDRDAFIEASKPIYEEFASEVDDGQSMIDKVRSLK